MKRMHQPSRILAVAIVAFNCMFLQPPEGELPKDEAGPVFARAGTVVHTEGTSRAWTTFEFSWEAPATCHQPSRTGHPNTCEYHQSPANTTNSRQLAYTQARGLSCSRQPPRIKIPINPAVPVRVEQVNPFSSNYYREILGHNSRELCIGMPYG
jgi:hypothetical protein